jgi:hypothetical protein
MGQREKDGRVRQATDDNIIGRMRIAFCVTKTTDKFLQYLIFLALARQKLLRKRASILRLYLHCLSCNITFVLTLPVL